MALQSLLAVLEKSSPRRIIVGRGLLRPDEHVNVLKPRTLCRKETAEERSDCKGSTESADGLPIVEWGCFHVDRTTGEEEAESVVVICLSAVLRIVHAYGLREDVAKVKESRVGQEPQRRALFGRLTGRPPPEAREEDRRSPSWPQWALRSKVEP